MDKAQIIQQLHKARPDHVFWVQEGRKLVKGLAEDKISKPLNCDACAFTLWYKNEGHKLVNIPQLRVMQDLHHEIHAAYTSLYFTTFDRRTKARSTIISGNIEIPIDEMPFRRKKLNALENKTVKFLKSLLLIEKEINEMDDQDFDNGWFN